MQGFEVDFHKNPPDQAFLNTLLPDNRSLARAGGIIRINYEVAEGGIRPLTDCRASVSAGPGKQKWGEQMADERTKEEKAFALVQRGLRAQEAGEIDRAIELYRDSIAIHPTAEGHTYLGWALSYQGKLDDAIEHCHHAIKIDPDFGNPYNDIGVYLMQCDRLDEAIQWLERAKLAPRYEPRHFPFINLGHIYSQRGELFKAIEEFKGALKFVPGDERIQRQIAELSAKLN
jgi:Tfp pilus assembly protein PilF